MIAPEPNQSPANTPKFCTFSPSRGKISAATALTDDFFMTNQFATGVEPRPIRVSDCSRFVSCKIILRDPVSINAAAPLRADEFFQRDRLLFHETLWQLP